jgi:hypothetical protein
MAGTGASAAGALLYVRQKSKDGNRSAINPQDATAKKRKVRVILTVDANSGTGALGVLAPNDEINLYEFPAGSYIDLKESYVILSATHGAGTTISLGNRAYTKIDGTTAAEVTSSLITNIDATATTLVQLSTKTIGAGALAPSGLGIINFDSRTPVVVFAKFLGGSMVGAIGTVDAWEFAYYVD